MRLAEASAKKSSSRRKRGLLLAYSAICHCVLLGAIFGNATAAVRLREQILFLTAVSFLLSAISIAVRSRRALAYCQVFRALVILLAVDLLGGDYLLIEILLFLPFTIETANRRLISRESIILLLTLLIALTIDGIQTSHAGVSGMTTHLAAMLAFTLPVLLLNPLLSNSVQALAESSERIKRLNYAIENLSNVNKDLQNYAESSRSLSAEEERNRITRDLHDLVGYALTNVIMLMNAIKVFLSETPGRLNEASEMVEQARNQAEDALQEARRILYQLRAVRQTVPVGLQAIVELTKVFGKTTHINVSLNYGNVPMSYGKEIDNTIYQVIQEGLTNAVRHGRADKITVNLWETNTTILLSVKDNGAGSEISHEGLGLKGMKERLSILGGSMHAHGEPYGFVLEAKIPLIGTNGKEDENSGPN